MKKQSEAFENKLKSALPRWALATCSIMFCFALTVRLIGIDISTPINRIFNAKATVIEQSAITLGDHEKRIKALEMHSHPKGK